MSVIREDILAIEVSGIAKVALEGLSDPDVIPLWFGESDLTTPDVVRDAAKAALDEGRTFYSYARGRVELRAALQRYHQRIYGIELAQERLAVPGSTMLSVVIACQCLLQRGDEIIIIGPNWPNIGMAAQVQGGRVVPVRLGEDRSGWHLDLDAVKAAISENTKALYVNSPSNPTGWIMTAEEAKALLELCREHGLGIISDEVYHRNVFEGANPAPSFLTLAEPEEPVFVVNGFSKAWAMTGWRLGWLVAPLGMVQALDVLAEINNTSATSFVQFGGVAALEHGEAFLESF
ncbi:MAG: aminotransferase class I/II-fold pyridoxal phosphate-dependent enzyme, partial [Pseudomonadota bacterium]